MNFLQVGDVFTRDQIEGYMELKWKRSTTTNTRRTRSSSRCIIPAEQLIWRYRALHLNKKGVRSGARFIRRFADEAALWVLTPISAIAAR